ncbi:MAG: neutral/alkaline non-lysosomal ceramidase N-terminal domain-containing protein [Sedimentisphaerales bacterium]
MNIGFSKINITPSLGTKMAGQLLNYKARGIESSLFAVAMYLDNGGTKIIFVSCDVLIISNETANEVCAEIEKATTVPAENVIVCTTHTHSGPITQDIFGMDADTAYITKMKAGIIEAARLAYDNCRPGKLLTAKGTLEGYAFNRRFIMSDGTIETHPLKGDPHIICAEGPDSKDLNVFYALNSASKPMGAMVVFGCHSTVMERENQLISSDYAGKVSGFISEKLGGVPVLFLQGASGNICQVNPRNTSNREVGQVWTRKMGTAIGQKAMELLGDSPMETKGVVRVVTEILEIPRRVIDNDLVQWAKHHKEIPAQTPSLSDYGVESYGKIESQKVSLEDLFKTPFWANFYANEILTRERDRMKQPRMPFKIKVIAQDNWVIVALPCELFVEWSNEICRQSPFAFTSVVELANGWNGYIPTKQAFERKGGYETKEVTSTMLIPEAGEMILETVIRMLNAAKM